MASTLCHLPSNNKKMNSKLSSFVFLLIISLLLFTAVPVLNAQTMVSTVAGTGYFGNTDGTGTEASFYYPIACTFYQQDKYILVTTDSNIRKIEYSTWTITTLAGSNSQTFADGVGSNAGFYYARVIAVTTDNSVAFVSDRDNNRIRRIDISTATVTTLAGNGTRGGTNGVGTNAQFNGPFGLALYPVDNSFLLITNNNAYTVVKLDISTATVSSFAGVYRTGSSIDGTGSGATFNYPYGISFHPTGSYAVIADYRNSNIRKITYPGAVVTTMAGSGARGSTDGTGTEATFNIPIGITIDVYGNYAVVGAFSASNLRKVVLSTAVVTTFAGIAGTAGSIDGAANVATFHIPFGVCFSQYDNAVVVTDYDKLRLLQGFEPTPTPTGLYLLGRSHQV